MSASPAPAVVREVVDLSRLTDGMDIRIMPMGALPPDLRYCLDAEVETGGITPDERAFVDLFEDGSLEWFTDLVENGGPLFAPTIRARFASWRAGAGLADRIALDWAGLRGLRWQLDECVRTIAYDAGREGEPGSPDEALSRAMRVAEGHHVSATYLAGVSQVAGRAAEDVAEVGIEAFLALSDRCGKLYERRSDILLRRDAAVRAWAAESRDEAPREDVRALRREARRKASMARRALARSLVLLESIAGRERARACIGGDEIVVAGRRFDFRLRVPDPNRVGVHAVDVFVTDKHGIELAALCVYNDDTPALDQVASLVLHVVSGDEDAILRTANVVRSTDAAALDPAFVSVRGAPRKRDADVPELVMLDEAGRRMRSYLPAAREAMARLCRETAWLPLSAHGRIAAPWDAATV